jgi:hypothetical protein
MGALIEELLAGKGWEAAHGFTLTDTMCTVIAAQAALVILGLDLDAYRDVRAIIVHPTTVISTVPRQGPVPGVVTEEPIDLLGEAHQQRGPVIVAWDAAEADARHPGTGSNVVVHEFAQARHARRPGRRHPTGPRREAPALGRGLHGGAGALRAHGDPLLRDCARRTPASSSRWRPRSSSTSPSSCGR